MERRSNAKGGYAPQVDESDAMTGPAGQSVAASKDRILLICKDNFVMEGDDVEETILRLGAAKEKCSFEYTTHEAEGQTNEAFFQETAGSCTMEPGERVKQVTVKTYDDALWSCEKRFNFCVTSTEGATLSRLNNVSCAIMDDDEYPCPKGHDQVWGFCKERLRGTRKGSTLTMINLAYSPIHWFIVTYGGKQIIDQGIGDRNFQSVVFWLVASVVSLGVHQYNLNQSLCHAEIGGSIEFLRVNMARKYLSMSVQSKNMFPDTRVFSAINEYSSTVVRDGFKTFFVIYESSLNLIAQLGLGWALLTQWNCVPLTGGTIEIAALLLLLPIGCALSMSMTRPLVLGSIKREQVAEEKMLKALTEMLICNRAIRNFDLQETRTTNFGRVLLPAKKCATAHMKARFTSTFGLHWVSTIVNSLVILTGCKLVISGEMEVGTYVATISVVSGIADSIQMVFEALLSMQACRVPLQICCDIMNAETMATTKLDVLREDKRTTLELLDPKKGLEHEFQTRYNLIEQLSLDDGGWAWMRALPIALRGVSYCWPVLDKTFTCLDGKPELNSAMQVGEVLREVSLDIKQSTITVVVGPPGGGKSTFLRLLGREIFPTSGTIFLPPMLSSLFVPLDVTMFEGTLMQNLKMATPYVSNEQVECLVAEFGVLQRYMVDGRLIADSSVLVGGTNFTKGDQMGVSLVRAFLLEPDVLVLERPAAFFDDATTTRFYLLLQEYVDNNGLKCMDRFNAKSGSLPSQKWQKMRPKSVILTTKENHAPAEMRVDSVISLDKGHLVISNSVKAHSTKHAPMATAESEPKKRSSGIFGKKMI